MPYWKEALVAIIGNTLLLVWVHDFEIWWALTLSTAVTVIVLLLWLFYKFLRRPRE